MPGDEHLYSNSGYAMLALAVERATGTRFAQYADASIFRPLGMPVSHFHTDLSRLVPRRAYAYDRRSDGSFVLNSPQNERAGAGGLFTTVRELVRWDENFYDGSVGGADVIRMLETPGRLNNGTQLSYAWGLTAGQYRGMPVVEHSGSLGGYRAHIIRFRPAHTSVAILCNVSNVATGAVVRRVADAVLAGRFEQPVPPPPPPAPSVMPSGLGSLYEGDELAAFAGEYYSDELESTYQVSGDGRTLKLRRGAQRQALTLRPGRKDEFASRGSVDPFPPRPGRRQSSASSSTPIGPAVSSSNVDSPGPRPRPRAWVTGALSNCPQRGQAKSGHARTNGNVPDRTRGRPPAAVKRLLIYLIAGPPRGDRQRLCPALMVCCAVERPVSHADRAGAVGPDAGLGQRAAPPG